MGCGPGAVVEHVVVHGQPLLLVVVCATVAGGAGVAAVVDAVATAVVDAVVAPVNLSVVEPDAVAVAGAAADRVKNAYVDQLGEKKRDH